MHSNTIQIQVQKSSVSGPGFVSTSPLSKSVPKPTIVYEMQSMLYTQYKNKHGGKGSAYMLIPKKSNDTDRESLEKFCSRVKNQLCTAIHTGEHRQEPQSSVSAKIVNLSSNKLAASHMSLLTRGPNFTPLSPPRNNFRTDTMEFTRKLKTRDIIILRFATLMSAYI